MKTCYTYHGIDVSLQFNGQTIGFLLQENSWKLIRRKDIVSPQKLQSPGRMSPVAVCCSSSPRGMRWLHRGWVHWTGSWGHWSCWLVLISSEPVQSHPSSILLQNTAIDSTALSKAMMSLKSDEWRDFLPAGQFVLLWLVTHCWMHLYRKGALHCKPLLFIWLIDCNE